MKKKLLTLLAILACMALVACGETKTSTSEEEKTSEETSTTSENAEETVDGQPLVVALEAGFAPFEYMGADGEVVGVDVDICEAIAASLNRPLKIENRALTERWLPSGPARRTWSLPAFPSSPSAKRSWISPTAISTRRKSSSSTQNLRSPKPRRSSERHARWRSMGNVADEWVSNEENTKPKEIKRYEKFAQAAEDLKNERSMPSSWTRPAKSWSPPTKTT